jgi:hypothetical protein
MRAAVAARANVRVDLVDVRTGRVLPCSRRHNLVTAVGLDLLRNLVYGDSGTITHGAVGTDNTAPAAADVALGAEIFRDQISQRTKQTAALVLKFVVGSQQANGEMLREAGLFTAAVGGSLYARVTPDEVAKTEAILVVYTWTLSWAAA